MKTEFNANVDWADQEDKDDDLIFLTVYTTNGTGSIIYDEKLMFLEHEEGNESWFQANVVVDPLASNWKVVLDLGDSEKVILPSSIIDGNIIDHGGENNLDNAFVEQ